MTLWENASLNCVIPKQPLSCVWWRELGFITASTGDSTSPERGGMRERDGARRREEARHHTDRMNDTSYDCLGRSCSLWLLYRTPTVLHFTSPGALIYYIQQNRHRRCGLFSPRVSKLSPQVSIPWRPHFITYFFHIFLSLFHFHTQMCNDRANFPTLSSGLF